MIGLKNLQDHVMFHAPRNLLGNSFQRDLAVFGNFIVESEGFFLNSLRLKNLIGAEDYVTRDAVLQFANVSRPVAIDERLNYVRRKRSRLLLEPDVELLPQVFG